jgi:hypothetical protein
MRIIRRVTTAYFRHEGSARVREVMSLASLPSVNCHIPGHLVVVLVSAELVTVPFMINRPSRCKFILLSFFTPKYECCRDPLRIMHTRIMVKM